MPQLDKLSFLPQIFWLILVFFSIYIMCVRYFLPFVALTLKIRSKKLIGLETEIKEAIAEEQVISKTCSQQTTDLLREMQYVSFHFRYLLEQNYNQTLFEVSSNLFKDLRDIIK